MTGNLIADLNELPERRAPGFERSVGNANNNVDYQQLQVQAAQGIVGFLHRQQQYCKKIRNFLILSVWIDEFVAMQGAPSRADVRVPTPNWSGYGFSQSSPSSICQTRVKEEVTVSYLLINTLDPELFQKIYVVLNRREDCLVI